MIEVRARSEFSRVDAMLLRDSLCARASGEYTRGARRFCESAFASSPSLVGASSVHACVSEAFETLPGPKAAEQ